MSGARTGAARLLAAVMVMVASGALAARPAAAQELLYGLQAAPASGSRVEASLPFRVRSGDQPIRVTLGNTTGKARRYRATLRTESESGSNEVTSELEVAADASRAFTLLAPAGKTWRLRLEGPGVSGEVSGGTWAQGSGPVLAVSPGLLRAIGYDTAAPRVGPDGAVRTPSGEVLPVDPAVLPSDPRALAGLPSLWLSAREWADLPAAAREVLLDRVAAGGRLLVIDDDGEPAPPGLPSGPRVEVDGVAAVPHGFGAIALRRAAQVADPGTLAFARGGGGGGVDVVESAAPRLLDLRPTGINAPLLCLALIGYAALVGPLNLLVFCRRTRARLFLTTPLLAAGASLGLALVILVGDGIGGSGSRLALIEILPGRSREALYQEQVSRTGLLVRSAFVTPEPVALTWLRGPDADERRELESDGGGRRFAGGWFASRSPQLHVLSTVRPSRGRLERLPGTGEAPAVVSSLDCTLDVLFVRDAQGALWRASRVVPGRPATLSRARDDEFGEWERTVTRRSLGPVGRRLDAARLGPGRYLAESAAGGGELEGGGGLVPTLGSIRWREDRVVTLGWLEGS